MYGSVMKIEQDLPHTWNVSASLNMNLTLTAALFFGIKATVIDYEAGRITLETAKKKLVRDVKKQFYNLLLMQENIRLMEENIDAAKDRYDQANINYQNGLVSEYTKLSAQVAWENMKPSLESLKVGYRSALLGFKQQLGLPNSVGMELQGAIEPTPLSLDAEALIEEYVTGRLDVQSLRKQIEMVKNSKDATIAGMTPALTFILNFDPAFTKDPFEDPWFEDPDEWTQRSGMFGISINVALEKLLPFSKTWIELKNTEDNLRKMEISLSGLVNAGEMEIETTVMNLNKSLDSIEKLELNVELAQRAYDMAEEAYNAGNRELLEVQNAELELKKARLEVLKEKYNYITGLFDLEYALNTTLEELKR
jgi:outer membrane protein TolC